MAPDPAGPIAIIANPVGGRGRAGRLADAVAALFARRGVPCRLLWTAAPGDAERLARAAAAECPTVVACGGDGTVHEVLNALAGTPTRLGVLPGGRCNDFARALGLPHDPPALADLLAGPAERRVSLGRVNGRWFGTVAALGFDAAVSDYVHHRRLPLRGTAAYLFAVLRLLPGYRPTPVRLAGDFGRIEAPLFLLAVGNAPFYGGGIPIVPGADLADDQLDLCLVRGLSLWRAASLLPAALSGRHVRAPEVQTLRTRTFTVESDPPLAVWADGEPVARTPAAIEAVPNTVKVAAPLTPAG